MTPAALSALHHAAFRRERPWSAQEFQDLLSSPYVAVYTAPHGFALSRTVADETELLTLAVDPAHHRQGTGCRLTQAWLTASKDIAQIAFLEVAADNIAALALYRALGFAQAGQRPAYYARKNAASVDAIVMRRDLTNGQPPDSAT